MVSSDFLKHLSDQLDLIVSEMGQALKPGGLLLYDTINRSFLARLLVIWGGTLAAPFLNVPSEVHRWPLLIKPAELVLALRRAGIQHQEIRGFSPNLPFWSIPANLLLKGTIGGFKVSRDLRLSYIGWREKLWWPGLQHQANFPVSKVDLSIITAIPPIRTSRMVPPSTQIKTSARPGQPMAWPCSITK